MDEAAIRQVITEAVEGAYQRLKENALTDLHGRIDTLDQHVEVLHQHLTGLATHLGSVGIHVESVEERLGSVEGNAKSSREPR